jgi:thiol:disulfide interchange protein/DsbC/DsbD-like thiol-disulfide interchange protein
MNLKNSILPSLLGLFFTAGSVIQAAPVRTEHVTAELVSEFDSLIAGEKNTIAIRLDMDDHWHTYWQHSGDTGFPTAVEWELPEGIKAGPLQWPAPMWIDLFGIVSFAYEGEVLLLADLEVPDSYAGSSVKLEASVSWLVCKEACIPGSAEVSLTIPVSDSRDPSSWAKEFEASRDSMPKDLPNWEMRVVDNGQSFALSVAAPEGVSLSNQDVTFFTLDGWVSNTEPRTALAEGRLLTMILPKSEYGPDEGKDRFQGVLVSKSGWDAEGRYKAMAVNLPFSSDLEVSEWLGSLGNISLAAVNSDLSPVGENPLSFGAALLFALVGGLMLNLMPCVFPVLSIKILGFVQQAGEDRTKIKLHGIVFTIGVLVSFWILAGLFLVLRAAGQEIGWGFQLQTPGFVAVLASVLFLFGLNLSGVFEIGESLTGAGGELQSKSGFTGSFFSGVLATVVATPCTAPFMGSALGIIVTLSAAQSMMIFTALALGVALPYLILSLFPSFLKWLPRPGAWMETFKKALAFLLYASVVWLAWVFGNQVGVTGMAGLLMGMVFIGIAAWIWGSWGNLTKRKSVRRAALFVALPILLVGGWIQYQASTLFAAPSDMAETGGSDDISWAPYDPDAVMASIAEGKTVYVDFTATWCLTCQVNKKVAFGNDEVIDYFKRNDIVTLKGDWTRRDPVITRELQKFGRSGVPTNIIYRPDGSSTLLPEVLTPGVVLEAFKQGG